jgi:hypothetical protein
MTKIDFSAAKQGFFTQLEKMGCNQDTIQGIVDAEDAKFYTICQQLKQAADHSNDPYFYHRVIASVVKEAQAELPDFLIKAIKAVEPGNLRKQALFEKKANPQGNDPSAVSNPPNTNPDPDPQKDAAEYGFGDLFSELAANPWGKATGLGLGGLLLGNALFPDSPGASLLLAALMGAGGYFGSDQINSYFQNLNKDKALADNRAPGSAPAPSSAPAPAPAPDPAAGNAPGAPTGNSQVSLNLNPNFNSFANNLGKSSPGFKNQNLGTQFASRSPGGFQRFLPKIPSLNSPGRALSPNPRLAA